MERLSETLNSVNDWLKFAEAKNAVLVAASGVGIWGCFRMAVLPATNCYVDVYLAIVALFMSLGFITSLLSFLPVLEYRWIVPRFEENRGGNLLYFGHLATFSKSELLKKYREATGSKESDVNELHSMYAEQVIINSRIALAKFAFFERAVNFVLWGVLTPVLAVPLLYVAKKRRKATDGVG